MRNLLSSMPTLGPPLMFGSSMLAYGLATVFYAVELLTSVRRGPGDAFKLLGPSIEFSFKSWFFSAILEINLVTGTQKWF